MMGMLLILLGCVVHRAHAANEDKSRVTWSGCKCKESWTDPDTGVSAKLCANMDNDPKGDWCMVEDPSCENADWGYCVPVASCEDQDWMDSQGYTCLEYAQEHFCTQDGGYGKGWRDEWGTFLDYADFEGHPATHACCMCGGGGHHDTGVSHISAGSACFDVKDWKDKRGNSCGTYKAKNFCTPHGAYGPGWHHDEWGEFDSTLANFSTLVRVGINATRACCACGGGVNRATSPIKAAWFKSFKEVQRQNVNRIRSMPRLTWNDCKCKKTWNMTLRTPLIPCDDFCCSQGDDPYGLWCMVEDPKCEDQDWGYCRPLPQAEAKTSAKQPLLQFRFCTDSEFWTDSDGDTCEDYGRKAWCTAEGSEGAGWHNDWGSLGDFRARDGTQQTAKQACCACGGGTQKFGLKQPVKFSSLNREFLNAIMGARTTWNNCECKKSWKVDDKQCASSCCNPDNDKNGEWCMVKDSKCEDSSWGYCKPLSKNVFLQSREKETCSDYPSGFKDKMGHTCEEYKEKELCNKTGGLGKGWKSSWGSYKDLADADGNTGYQACCACGGGSRQPALKHCVDMPGFRDKEGDACASYYSMRWCNPWNPLLGTGSRYGPGWKEEWGIFEDFENEDGLTALDACCACSGGLVVHEERLAREEIAKELIMETWGLVIIIPLCCLCGCCGTLVLFLIWKSKVPVNELPAAVTHAARKYGKFDDGSV
eukprot:TRINITY_DN111828_c0_g1_i1.p1 TRINITY_DN111828_c0_g1~~TRINITY_DN111828_c0_g1_i1.p1  ORF type:complete len:705 (-),score=131.92 TRINITY_DN111828_c0_g1_i1:33-2147(-)